MKQITWKGGGLNPPFAVFRESLGEAWQPITQHPEALGESDFERFQCLLKMGYEGVAA